MRAAGFLLALGALLFACVDFWQRTLPQLRRGNALRRELATRLETDLERVERSGAPPSHAELAAARTAERTLAHDLATLHAAWHADALRAGDYLVPRAARPAPATLGTDRERITQALLALPAELKLFPGLTTARLGLEVLSLTESLPTDPERLVDQAERAVATRHLLLALRSLAAVRVENASLQRSSDAGLVLRLEALAGISDAVALYERMLAPSDDAPPRRLRRFQLARKEPRDWGLNANELPEPPVQVSLAVGFEFPATAGARR